jgi:hypothetical protein
VSECRSIHNRTIVFYAMTAKNRAGLITKLQTSLKKHYKPAPAAPGRPLMEHVLYAALLEDAPVDLADEGFAKCEQEFFDWNEVRVTSVTELAEVLSHFPSPASTALRLKRCLQSVFESFYSFEIDHLKKENLGKAVAKFESMNGVTPFVLSYLVQHGLGGHAIPVNQSGIWIMFKTGVITESEARTGKVPGLERAIPKSKAIEFSSMLHQAAIALAADPVDKLVWEVIWSVNKDAEMSAPKAESKRRTAKAPAPAPEPPSKPAPKSGGKSKGGAAAKAAEPQSAASQLAETKLKAASGKSAAKTKATDKTTEAAAEKPAVKGEAKSKTKAAATPAPVAPPTTPAASPSPVAKGKGAAAKAKPVEKAAEKAGDKPAESKPSAKKSVTAKTPEAPAPKASPAKETSKKAEPQKAKETADPAVVGNQKLTKRKPR